MKNQVFCIGLTVLLLAGCNKEQIAANCRLDVARKWSVDVTKSCMEPLSPFASTIGNTFPKCSEADQAKSFMQFCMKTAGYALESRCVSDRFEQFGRRCYRRTGVEQFVDEIMDSALLSDTASNPRGGYAWNKQKGRLEWMDSFWTSQTECMDHLNNIVREDTFNRQFYSVPIGCAYNGNSYWRVRILNALWGGSELGCIAMSGEPAEATKIGMLYGPVLGRTSPHSPGDEWHCV
jgi:hypothetical protein